MYVTPEVMKPQLLTRTSTIGFDCTTAEGFAEGSSTATLAVARTGDEKV